MAYKKNPKDSEQICALSAAVMSFHSMAGYAAANNLLERTLNESAIRRVFIPEAFLYTDHCLIKAHKVISGLVINREKIARDLRTHGDFAGTGRLLVRLQQMGVPREEAYRMIQSCSLQAQEAVVRGEENPLRGFSWGHPRPPLSRGAHADGRGDCHAPGCIGLRGRLVRAHRGVYRSCGRLSAYPESQQGRQRERFLESWDPEIRLRWLPAFSRQRATFDTTDEGAGHGWEGRPMPWSRGPRSRAKPLGASPPALPLPVAREYSHAEPGWASLASSAVIYRRAAIAYPCAVAPGGPARQLRVSGRSPRGVDLPGWWARRECAVPNVGAAR